MAISISTKMAMNSMRERLILFLWDTSSINVWWDWIAFVDSDDISMIRNIVANGFWNFERDGEPLYMSGYNMFNLIKCDSFQFLKQLLSFNVSSWALMQSAFLRSYYERDAVLLNALYLNSVRSQMDL